MWINEPITEQLDGSILVPNLLTEIGDSIIAHRHVGDHLSLCASGSANIITVRNDISTTTKIIAGEDLWIPGGCVHSVIALEPNTLINCIWSKAQFEIERAKGGCVSSELLG